VNALPTLAAIGGTASACIGSSTILTNTTSGGVWTSSTTAVATVNTITGAVSGVAAGSTTITYTYTNSNGCTSSVTQLVTINALPVVAAITGTPSVCEGATTTLASATAGGVWTSSNTATATINASTGVVSGVAAGSATMTYTVTNVNGCVKSVTQAVTVNALPVVASISGTTEVCAGSTTALTSATTGGVWTSSNAAVATVSSVSGIASVLGIGAGSATITYTVTNVNGCVTAVNSTVVVNPLPVLPVITANGPTMLCPNTTVDLSVPSVYTSYFWNNGMVNNTITTGLPGYYFVTVTNNFGCVISTVPVAVSIGDTINPVIIAPADIALNITSGCAITGVDLGIPVTSDNCSVVNITNNAPFTFPIGTTVVTWTAYDAFDNLAITVQTVTVSDTIVPQIIAPDTVVVQSNLSCEAAGIFIGSPIAGDNCSDYTIVNNAPAIFPLGTTNVLWTITDGSGNVATASQIVIVEDDIAPYVNLVDVTLSLDLTGSAILTFDQIDVNSNDNCGIDTILFSQTDFGCKDVGINTVTITVIDNSGNSTIANIYVTIEGSGIDTDFDGIDDSCDDFIDTTAIVIPSGFTPNSDNINDYFEILGLGNYETKILFIYNRYGNLVFQSDSYNNTWNGTLLNTGELLPDATYYYLLELDNGKRESGYVYINRVQ
jgi:gliding motility-associated-like protein